MTLWDLVQQAARSLTGGPVIVRNRQPIYQGYLGMAQKRGDGTPIVDISPGVSDDEFITIFCHEMAHVKLHVSKFAPSNVQLEPQSVKDDRRPVIAQAAYNIRETEADKLAAEWVKYAARHYVKYDGYSVLEQKLKALLNIKG